MTQLRKLREFVFGAFWWSKPVCNQPVIILDRNSQAGFHPAMPTDEIKTRSAKDIWDYLKTRQRVYFATMKDFSPQSLWVIDQFFRLCSGDGPDRVGSPFDTKDTLPLIFSLGAYIGEVVRQHYGDKCEWGDEVLEGEISLHLPGDKEPLHPMDFIRSQMDDYKPESIVRWGLDAGLPVGERPKFYNTRFRKTD